MTISTSISRHTRAADDYLGLIRRFPLRAIHSDADLRTAYAVIDPLALKGTRPGGLSQGESDYLDALCILCKEYEDQHVDMKSGHADAVDVLKALMGERGMNASDLGKLLGNRSLGGAILRRECALSKNHIRVLATHFRVTADVLL